MDPCNPQLLFSKLDLAFHPPFFSQGLLLVHHVERYFIQIQVQWNELEHEFRSVSCFYWTIDSQCCPLHLRFGFKNLFVLLPCKYFISMELRCRVSVKARLLSTRDFLPVWKIQLRMWKSLWLSTLAIDCPYNKNPWAFSSCCLSCLGGKIWDGTDPSDLVWEMSRKKHIDAQRLHIFILFEPAVFWHNKGPDLLQAKIEEWSGLEEVRFVFVSGGRFSLNCFTVEIDV